MKNNTTFNKLALATAITAMGLSQLSLANVEVMEEILVSADFRDVSLRDIASSVAVFDSLAIEAKGAQHLEQLLGHAPNVNFSSGASRARYFQIRGIGLRSQFVEPINPSVGVIVDGIDMSGIGSGVALMDVKQVEILNGPQGTAYGANALAGLINVQSNDPAEEFTAKLAATVAEYGSYTAEGAVSAPISEQTGIRFAFNHQRSDGFIKNDHLGRSDTNNIDETALRAKLVHQYNEQTVLAVTALYVDNDNGYDAFSLDNSRHTLSDNPGHDRQTTYALAAKLEFAVSDEVDAEVLLSASKSDLEYGYDEDWAFVGLHPSGYSAFDNYQRQRDNYNLDLRLMSSQGGKIFSGSSDWLIGAYYFDQEVDLDRQYSGSTVLTSSYEIQRAALYGQLDANLSERVTVTAGLRYERHSSRYLDSNAIAGDIDENLWGGRLALSYAIDDEQNAYALLSRGYKAGGFNTDGDLNPEQRPFEAESLLNYELGYKAFFSDLALQLRVAAFYQDRTDVQIKSSNPVLKPAGNTIFVDYFDNSAKGDSYGLEVSSDWQASADLNVSMSLGLLNAELEDEDFSRSNGEPAHAPGYQFSASLNYAFSDVLTAGVNVEAKDDFYFSDSHDEKAVSYALLNANMSYQLEQWTLVLWGKNLTNKDYFVRGFGGFGNDPRDGYASKGYFQYGAPRQIGVKASYQF